MSMFCLLYSRHLYCNLACCKVTFYMIRINCPIPPCIPVPFEILQSSGLSVPKYCPYIYFSAYFDIFCNLRFFEVLSLPGLNIRCPYRLNFLYITVVKNASNEPTIARPPLQKCDRCHRYSGSFGIIPSLRIEFCYILVSVSASQIFRSMQITRRVISLILECI